jgi:VIT1/CCC1 family predicted Fe2+/Mn2+ transporter
MLADVDAQLARRLVLDELFDLSLYRALRGIAPIICASSSISSFPSRCASLLVAGAMIVVVSMLLAFLSGMDVRRRIAINVLIIAAAVVVTYAIGALTRALWGISL